jgi:hypothetical protein
MITLDVRELGIAPNATPFASGAVGELFHVPVPVPSLPGRALVYKSVKAVPPKGLDRARVFAQMRSAVAVRDALSPNELADLDEVTVWPLAMVRDGGADAGILIDLIPAEFFVDTRPPGGPAGKALFELQFLSVSGTYFTKMGIDPSVTGDDVTRLALAARLAYAVEVVHRQPVVFGDLHLKNAVAAAKPLARVLLIDCDGVADLTDVGRIQLHGPFFSPPEIVSGHQKLQDQETDVYKLGLCIIRCLSPGKGATQHSDPVNHDAIAGLLDREGIEILRRAVSRDRASRPRAGELREYLVRRVRALIQLPELLSASLSHRVALRGSEIFVRWQQRYGTEVRVYGANGFVRERIDPDRFANGYAIRPDAAGPIDVEVWNRHGPSPRVRAGYFDYYELPALDIAGQLRGVARPTVPDLPALDAAVFEPLRPYPVVTGPELSVAFPAPVLEFPAVVASPGPDRRLGRWRGDPTATLQRAQRMAGALTDKTVNTALRRLTRVMRERVTDAPARADRRATTPSQQPFPSP